MRPRTKVACRGMLLLDLLPEDPDLSWALLDQGGLARARSQAQAQGLSSVPVGNLFLVA